MRIIDYVFFEFAQTFEVTTNTIAIYDPTRKTNKYYTQFLFK